jgi:hypothetical protein
VRELVSCAGLFNFFEEIFYLNVRIYCRASPPPRVIVVDESRRAGGRVHALVKFRRQEKMRNDAELSS